MIRLKRVVASHINPSPRVEAVKEALAGKRVLLVEDSGFLCFALEQTLREAGCEIVGPCCLLEEAMDEASHHELDCALLDINLRGEMVSPLAAHLRERGVPFVLTSAYSEHELPADLIGEPQIRKPFTDKQVLESLASVLARQ